MSLKFILVIEITFAFIIWLVSAQHFEDNSIESGNHYSKDDNNFNDMNE
jgi:hypothetical protein